ncbi:MAG: hypothetical protein Q9220_000322 [cf. Caloplaca sp. 1 TL-2023]
MASSLNPGLNLAMVPLESPPTSVQSNFVDPPSLADETISVSLATSVIAILFLIIRLYSTSRITRTLWYDDGASVLATLFSLAYIGLFITLRDNARHGWDIPVVAYTTDYFRKFLISTILSAFALLFSKISILLLMHRLFSTLRTFRYCIYFGILWATLISCTSIIVAPALCAPRGDESFSSLGVVKRCTKEKTWALVQGVLNVLLDFYILSLPVPTIWKLQIKMGRKLGIIAIFMTGLGACLVSVASLAYKVKLVQSSDTSWNTYKVNILNIAEINVAIVVACMPACASFFRFLITKNGLSNLRIHKLWARGDKDSPDSKNLTGSRLMNLISGREKAVRPQITESQGRSGTSLAVHLNTLDHEREGIQLSNEADEKAVPQGMV